ncbi:MAG: glycosyltransferase [Saprospiraceae bacterium]|jgi:cellulose synthase/poly-beta-1,6-N-acetylglucosamine synthase-like glycosyltransferase|nr:glycosyltransferase [Saprospiraceae bacterium]
MFEIFGYVLVIVYSIALIYITIYCLMQLHLLYRYLFSKAEINKNPNLPAHPSEWPFVTIQLPLYNEKYVAERLIDNIILLDYPKESLEIQILDDSTDDTTNIVNKKVAQYQKLGYNICSIRRTTRNGFKAGALKEGMSFAQGKYIAIFDADFLPKRDFLKKTVPAFEQLEIGVVQTRWAHINQKDSLLTEMQAMQLNVHFTVEQTGRFNAGYFLQFNGTAGIWRKKCITDAGGWEADTLTEDLDLSYRAQLKGWKIHYMEDVLAPAELPSEINGLKSQQFRWMKGGAETAKKLLPKVWLSEISFTQKIQASIHLLSSTVFIFVFLLGVFSFPLLFFINPLGLDPGKFSIFMISMIAIIMVYYVANVQTAWPKENKLWMIFKFVFLFPVFLSLSMGLAFHNALAVIQGLAGRKSPFVRTPKYGTVENKTPKFRKTYFSKRLSLVSVGEGLLSLYFIFAVYYGWNNHMAYFLLFHMMLALGYFILFLYALRSKLFS